ncbi:MAG: hypothetical protein MRY83_07370 [Flavobacteriales bacterium]|nr:hypothetical protein [Flavobacteriales bacterium]
MVVYRLFLIILLTACNNEKKLIPDVEVEPKTYTVKSTGANKYNNFNSEMAINRIAEIENEYFNAYYSDTGLSKYYGTVWRSSAENVFIQDTLSLYQKYVKKLLDVDSMHCTIYAIEGLRYGLDSSFEKLNTFHTNIWDQREFAGWSVAHILTEFFDWKAYLFLSRSSSEYDRCLQNFRQNKEYYVWRQPNIQIENLYHLKSDTLAIDSLLRHYEFGWGFSEQGWHTWVTRFDTLKECNWSGSPNQKLAITSKPLFLKTKFTEYTDYNSHVIVFPPMK